MYIKPIILDALEEAEKLLTRVEEGIIKYVVENLNLNSLYYTSVKFIDRINELGREYSKIYFNNDEVYRALYTDISTKIKTFNTINGLEKRIKEELNIRLSLLDKIYIDKDVVDVFLIAPVYLLIYKKLLYDDKGDKNE